MTRREILQFSLVALARVGEASSRSDLGMEAYIFQQYAQRQHKSLGDILPEVIPMVKATGFQNIELNSEFLTAELKDKTLDLIRANGVKMPSVYSGGVMHEAGAAEKTMEQALRIGRECQPFGCVAVVFNANPKGEGIEKTDAELAVQAASMNRLGQTLSANHLELRLHNHTPEMVNHAREWRYNLRHTNPKFVSLCLDLDWVHQGGEDPLALLKEAGDRVTEVHLRNSQDKLWLESLEDGDIDYRRIAEYSNVSKRRPYLVVELAYRQNTLVSRPLLDDLKMSRLYAEEIFGLTK